VDLADFRKQHGLSQRELAAGLSEALGRTIHHQYVGKWERRGEVPDDVAAALGLDQEPPLDAEASARAPRDTSLGERRDGSSSSGDRAPAAPGARRGEVMPSPAQLRERIQKFYEVIGEAVEMADPHDGLVIKNLAPQAAAAWLEVCEEHPFAARVWGWLTLGGAWGSLAWVHAPAVVLILAHHNLLPELRLFPDATATHGQTERAPTDGAEAPVGAAPAPPAG
jgi:transcriptional regulator with XRE-family HTH domain